MDEAKTMEGPRAGRRTIGQEAGHEIHLEIEDVLEQRKKLVDIGQKKVGKKF